MIKIQSNFYYDIYQKERIHTIKTDCISWETEYLCNDIQKLSCNNNKIDCYIYYENQFYYVIIEENKILQCDNKNLYNKIYFYLSISNNMYDFLNKLSTHLELECDEHDNMIETLDFEDVELESKEDDSDSDWNPYTEFEDNFESISKIDQLIIWKSKACIMMQDSKSKIDSNFIINVIIQELKDIYENCNNVDIIPIDDNIFNIDFKFKLSDHDVIMNIKLNNELYPYYPPQVSFKTKLKNKLDISIINLKYFNIDNWNPTNTLKMLINGVYKILEENSIILDENENTEFNLILQNLLSLNSIILEDLQQFDIEFIQLDKNNTSKDTNFWKAGTGYSIRGKNEWDIDEFIKSVEIKQQHNNELIKKLYEYIIENNENYINDELIHMICTFLGQMNIIEFENNIKFYTYIFKIIFKLDLKLVKIKKCLKIFYDESIIFFNINKSNSNKLYDDIMKFYEDIIDDEHISNNSLSYCDILAEYQLGEITFDKYNYNDENSNPTNECIKSISKEISSLSTSLPLDYDSSIFLKYDENNIQHLKSLIIGPKDTPYENGCFIFDIFIPNNYPNEPPLINLEITGNNKVRFNPNLYESGKVCLSLLGTWSGFNSEKWNKDTSTLLQVLISIQSLILIENPYFNEPSHETLIGTKEGDLENANYNNDIYGHTIKWAINDLIENPHYEFETIINEHFKFKRNDIIKTLDRWKEESPNNKLLDEQIKIFNK